VEYLLDVVDELHENGWDVTCFMDADARPGPPAGFNPSTYHESFYTRNLPELLPSI